MSINKQHVQKTYDLIYLPLLMKLKGNKKIISRIMKRLDKDDKQKKNI